MPGQVGAGFTNCGADGGAHSSGAGAWQYGQGIPAGSTAFLPACDMRQFGWGYGLYVLQYANSAYVNGATGVWQWAAPTDTYVSAVQWSGLGHRPGNNVAGNTTLLAGIGNVFTGWDAVNEWGQQLHVDWYQAVSASSHARSQFAIVGLRVNGNGSRAIGAYSQAEGATVYLKDDYAPTVELTGHTPAAPGSPAQTAWFDSGDTPPMFRLGLADRGLGIWQYTVVRNDTGASLTGTPQNFCLGTKAWKCPNSQDTGALFYWQSAIPEGITPVHAVVWDMNERTGNSPTWSVRVDRTAPQLTVGGLAYSDRDSLTETTASVTVSAADGSSASSATQRSGVRQINIYVDGSLARSTGALTCPTASCPASLAMSASVLDGGEHTIEVRVTDQLGHESTKTWTVNYYPTSGQYGGADHSINTAAEAANAVAAIENASVSTGDDMWTGISLADRLYIANIELSTDPQQMCREAFYDDYDGYETTCEHTELLWDDDAPSAIASGFGDYKKLNSEEKSLCAGNPFHCRRFFKDAKRATRFAAGLFTGPESGSDNTMANAFKHSYWTALMTTSAGDLPDSSMSRLGFEFAKAHEGGSYAAGSNTTSRKASRMDMINNRVGYWYANANQAISKAEMCKDLYYRAASAAYFGVDPDPNAEYEQRGYAADLSHWEPIYTLVYRKQRTRGGGALVEPDSPGGARCDN